MQRKELDQSCHVMRAKALGLSPGWYGNNCYCRDMYCQGAERCFEGDVKATLEWGPRPPTALEPYFSLLLRV